MDTDERDERLRRLEAYVVSSDRALQLQAESLMAAAARRAERTAVWGVLALSGAAALVVLDLWFTRRKASDMRRVLASGRRSAGAPRFASWLVGTGATLWQVLPALRTVWRAVSGFAAEHERGARRR